MVYPPTGSQPRQGDEPTLLAEHDTLPLTVVCVIDAE